MKALNWFVSLQGGWTYLSGQVTGAVVGTIATLNDPHWYVSLGHMAGELFSSGVVFVQTFGESLLELWGHTS